MAGSLSQHTKERFLGFKPSVRKALGHNGGYESTVLIAKYRIQNITGVPATEKETFCSSFIGWLVAQKGNGRSVADRVKVAAWKYNKRV
jgi:hypothetical protein